MVWVIRTFIFYLENRNLLLFLSVSFFINSIILQGLSKLQSSLHLDEGMGVVTQAVLYGTLVLSCIFLPKIIIRYLGHKWTVPIMFIGYITWLAANGYVRSILSGLCVHKFSQRIWPEKF